MTTPAAAKLYEAQHVFQHEGLGVSVFNPKSVLLEDLPRIYGFNNGGSPGWMSAVLLSEDGTCLGSHVCSSEAYMSADLGILADTRPDRHETFREHHPEGYVMEFVRSSDIVTHEKLQAAFKLNTIMGEAAKKAKGTELQCTKCGWIGPSSELIAPTSAHEPSCPECLNDDFVDVEEAEV